MLRLTFPLNDVIWSEMILSNKNLVQIAIDYISCMRCTHATDIDLSQVLNEWILMFSTLDLKNANRNINNTSFKILETNYSYINIYQPCYCVV